MPILGTLSSLSAKAFGLFGASAQSTGVSFTTLGSQTYTVPTGALYMTFKVWGSGGTGSGECVSSSGGGGGYVQGKISVTSGETITVFVGQSGSGSASPGQAGYGAGLGGQYSYVKRGSELGLAGGGGGAGQSGSGGGGGGNGSGLNGGGSNAASGGTQGAAGGGGTGAVEYTTNNSSPTEGGIYHERFSGVNTVFNVSGQVSATHTNTFDYNYTFNTPYDNSSYSVSASNSSAYTNITANGTVVPAGFYSVVDNKSSSGFRLRWFRNDDNSAVNVRYHSITCSGSRTTVSYGNAGSNGSFWNNGSNTSDGGTSGGTGSGYSNRGGGGGSGYYGGGGGGGGNNGCTGGGGGGGSGIISGSVSSPVSYTGSTGTSGGVSAVNSGDVDYVPGRGGSSQDGLVVLIFENS